MQRFILWSYFLACWMPASCLMDHEWVSFIQALSKVNLSSSTRFSVVQPLCLALLWRAQSRCFCISRFQLGCGPTRLVSRESKTPPKRKKWWKLPGKISQTLQVPCIKKLVRKTSMYQVGLILLCATNNSICLWITSGSIALSVLSCRKIVKTVHLEGTK